MTLQDIERNLYRRLNFADTPDPAVTTRLRMFLNQRHRSLLTSPALRQLREGYGQITSVSGEWIYSVPYGIARLHAVRDLTNQRTLMPLAYASWRHLEADPSRDSGTPDCYVPIGERAILRQPAGSGLFAVSSHPADTTQTLTVMAARTATLPRGAQETITTALTGTTPVAIGVNVYDDVHNITMSAVAQGAIIVTDAAVPPHVIATIAAGRRSSRGYVFALHPTPASPIAYAIDYEHAIWDLVNAWDEPLLPEDFQDLLIFAVLLDEYAHRDDSRYSAAMQAYRERLSDLKCYLYGHRAATQKGGRTELAPLGPWFPAQWG